MEFLKRYGEQVETTVETMRRRVIGIYDGVIQIGKSGKAWAEKAHEVGEPIAYDVKDAVTSAMNDVSALDANDAETRNSLLELYLGCSVLSIGLSAGEISGAFILGSMYERIFDGWMEVLLVFILPYYIYLSFRKNAALDEMERRVNLFGLALSLGSMLGHLMGNKLICTMPAVLFIQPLVIGLAVDSELSPPSVYGNRKNLLGISCGAGIVLSTLFILIHGLTLCAMSTIILQGAILCAHFQIVIYCIINKQYGAGEAQLGYVIATLMLHVLAGGLLGNTSSDTA